MDGVLKLKAQVPERFIGERSRQGSMLRFGLMPIPTARVLRAVAADQPHDRPDESHV